MMVGLYQKNEAFQLLFNQYSTFTSFKIEIGEKSRQLHKHFFFSFVFFSVLGLNA